MLRLVSILTLGVSLAIIGCNETPSGEVVETNQEVQFHGFESQMNQASQTSSQMNNRPSSETILEIAAGNEDFEILAQAVIFAELDETLDGRRQFTVFAPTDDAFEALLNELGLTAEELLVPENKELVTNILLYHVAPGRRPSQAVSGSEQINTLLKKFIDVEMDNGNLVVGNEENGFANIIATDISASNGFIHIIDAVMLPPTSSRPPATN